CVRVREGDDAAGARAYNPELRNIIHGGCSYTRGRRGKAIEIRIRCYAGIAKRFGEATADCCRRPDSDLLTNDSSQAELKSVERAGHTDPGCALYEWGQPAVPAQVIGNDIGTRVQIEQRANPAQQSR